MSGGVLSDAAAHHRAGRLSRAAELCAAALQSEPRCAEAFHLLGIIASQMREFASAAHFLDRAIEYNPCVAAYFNDLGVVSRKLGQAEERCLVCYREALRLDPDYLPAHRNLGRLLWERKQLEEALEHLRRVVELDATHSESHGLLGAVLADLGRAEEAEICFRRAVELEPKSEPALMDLGKILSQLNRPAEAEDCFRRVLQRSPNSIAGLNGLAVALSDQGRIAESLARFQRALELSPDDAETHCNLGHALLCERHFAESIRHLRRALVLKPAFPEAWNNLAGALQGEALTSLNDDGLEQAEACYRRALAEKPDAADVHVNLGMLLLMRGRFEEGWREYHHRLESKKCPRRFLRPLWAGEPFQGRTLLLHVEQGLGDTIQFVRFIAGAKKRGGRVILLCQRALKPLFVGCRGIDLLLDEDDPLPWFDFHTPLMSLAGILGTTEGFVPGIVPYIYPDPDQVAHWKKELASYSGLRVGIAWQGNPRYAGDRWRSLPLKCFEPLLELSGVHVFSLQSGFGREQITQLGNNSRMLDLDLPFSETAAAMTSLDLIITCDTVVAHLAGALGRPIWVAIPTIPDWRWGTHGQSTSWYPSLRLFRQSAGQDWSAVLQIMTDVVVDLVLRRKRSQSLVEL